MSINNRREEIKNLLYTSLEPIKGKSLADKFNVTRQVIVKDIAIIKAEGVNVIATPRGYMISKDNTTLIKTIIAVNHKREEVEDELITIVKYGGIVEDIIVEHPLYGEIRAMLMIKNLFDLENFCNNFNNHDAEPLSILTNGVHLHTISCNNKDSMDKILVALNNKGFLIKDENKK